MALVEITPPLDIQAVRRRDSLSRSPGWRVPLLVAQQHALVEHEHLMCERRIGFCKVDLVARVLDACKLIGAACGDLAALLGAGVDVGGARPGDSTMAASSEQEAVDRI